MRKRMTAIKTLAVGAMIVALGGAALGADLATSAGSANAAGMTAADHATLNVDLPAAAASVIASLVGGTNPSTLSGHGSSNDHANAARDNVTTETEATETETDNDNEVEAGHDVAPTGTSGTKPGFGCGDTNHTHSGPPGRPNASLPPGCTKH